MEHLLSILKLTLLVGLLVSCMILFSMITIQSAASSTSTFPENWRGTWRGTMLDRSVNGRYQKVPMTLRIQPISNNPMRYTWQTTYGVGDKKLVRDYELVVKDQQNGHFIIDEKDGTLIDAWWLGDKLYSQFRVNNLLLSTQCQRQGNRLHYELVLYQPQSTPPTESSQEKVPFESYQLQVVQSAELSPMK